MKVLAPFLNAILWGLKKFRLFLLSSEEWERELRFTCDALERPHQSKAVGFEHCLVPDVKSSCEGATGTHLSSPPSVAAESWSEFKVPFSQALWLPRKPHL